MRHQIPKDINLQVRRNYTPCKDTTEGGSSVYTTKDMKSAFKWSNLSIFFTIYSFMYALSSIGNFQVNAFVTSLHTQQSRKQCGPILYRNHPNALPSISSSHRSVAKMSNINNDNFHGDDEVSLYGSDDFVESAIPMGEDENDLDEDVIHSLTVPQLKQQLRLRGLKVTGLKQDLINRLIRFTKSSSSQNSDTKVEVDVIKSSPEKRTKAQEFAEAHGKEFIDVSAYIDEEEEKKKVTVNAEDNAETDDSTEVWGEEARKVRITSDLNDDNPVIDNLSRTIIEYSGYRKERINAFVTASRDALKGYLSGGTRGLSHSLSSTENDKKRMREQESMERVRDIQIQREKAAKIPLTRQQQSEIDEGIVESDEKNTSYDNVIERDYSDWGVYTHTGAQISAGEVQGILYLSDVRGPFSKDAKALCEKIAFECQPCVVMAPDLFRGRPWEEIDDSGLNKEGQDYEEWRAHHFDERVNVDIRASAAILRERYAVTSIAVFGTCFGGGRALEAAAGWIPHKGNNAVTDKDVNIITGPKLVEPSACIAWYPTRYDAANLFGNEKNLGNDSKLSDVAIMGIFADEDVIPGATQKDAATLKDLLETDNRVKDNMIKVFSGQQHGFAHMGLGDRDGEGVVGGGDGEVAALLSTAFLETYTRMFLPTVGVPIKNDDGVGDWTSIEMNDDIGKVPRDIRAEIAAAEQAYDDAFNDLDLDYNDVGTKFW